MLQEESLSVSDLSEKICREGRELREGEACLKDVLFTDGRGCDALWGMTRMCAMEKLAVMYKLVPTLVSTVYP